MTDEQHRFGVNQRAALGAKGENPHLLVMSATPIPRTLALIIYGELDVSLIDELPPGRQKVDTFAVDSSYRERLNGFIAKLAGEGRQAFVVCPRIEDDEEGADELKSAEEHAEELRRALPELNSNNHNIRASGERMARNTPIQGTAADVIKLAMVRVWRRLRDEKMESRLILTVHDELIVEAPEAEAEKAAAILREEMEGCVQYAVPLSTDVHTGKNWLEAH